MSRLTIDITDQQHRSLAAMAALQGKTVGEYAIECLFPDVADEDEAWAELKAVLEQRIADAEAGAVSPLTIRQIAEEVLGTDHRA